MLTHMFHELPSYCVMSIEAPGRFLRLAVLPTETRLLVIFWADHSIHSISIAAFPGRVCNSTTLISPIHSFLALLDKRVQLLFVSEFAPRFVWSVSRVLPATQKVLCYFYS